MSSLAAARADNFYYPPQYDPSKGSLNQFNGQHPLRERAKKLDQGILVIRFEMPFNVWCEGCGHLIGTGVRFNAEKKAVGNYHSTKIWSFTMRSPCCQTRIEIQTDPKNARYVIISGARQKVESWSAADTETMELPDSEEKPKLDDPFYKLEKGNEDSRRGREGRQRVTQLLVDSDLKYRDDYAINKQLRREMRGKRKVAKQTVARHKALGLPSSVPLLPESSADAAVASLQTFGDAHAFDKARQLRRQAIREGSIFSAAASPTAPSASGSAVPARKSAGSGSHRLAVASGSGTAKRSGSSAGSGSKAVAGSQTGLQSNRRRLGFGVKLGLSGSN